MGMNPRTESIGGEQMNPMGGDPFNGLRIIWDAGTLREQNENGRDSIRIKIG